MPVGGCKGIKECLAPFSSESFSHPTRTSFGMQVRDQCHSPSQANPLKPFDNSGAWWWFGGTINSDAKDLLPTVSPDGRYLFFSSERRTYVTDLIQPLVYEQKIEILDGPGNGRGDIWWVDASVIENLKPSQP
jgi:WD40-like Beta Propeller Repeat